MGKTTKTTETPVPSEQVTTAKVVDPLVQVTVRTSVDLDDQAVLRTIQELHQVSAFMEQEIETAMRITKSYVQGRARRNLVGEKGRIDYYQQAEVANNTDFEEEARNTFIGLYKRSPEITEKSS